MARPLLSRSLGPVLAGLLSLSPAGARAAAPAPAALRIEPATVDIGMLYRGATVRVEGTAPAGMRIAFVCVGKSGRVELKRKGKVANVLWMNVGSISFDRVPSLLLVSAEPEGTRARAPVIPADLRLGLGVEGVERQVLPEHAGDAERGLFRELVRLKERERLYAFETLDRELAAVDGGERVSTQFYFPARAPPGEYEIRMIGYRDGTGELLASGTITARRVGLTRLVARMAERHALAYGILSVLAALVAGAVSGFLFSSKKVH